MPAILLQASEKQYHSLNKYGENLGLAFQIVDDILDFHQGELNQFSFPAILSLDECKQRVEELKNNALAALKDFGKSADPLRQIANDAIKRSHGTHSKRQIEENPS